MTDITMPKLSDSMEEGTILSWLKADGHAVAAGEELAEIETDKATMTYESPAAGTLTILAAAGDTLAVGTLIARLGERASQVAPTVAAELPATADPPRITPPLATTGSTDAVTPIVTAEPKTTAVTATARAGTAANGHLAEGEIRATPIARRLAEAHGIDLAAVAGSGPRGRIVRADVLAAVGTSEPHAAARSASSNTAPAVSPPADPPAASGGVIVRKLTRLQQVVARRMAEAKASVPEFQVQTEVQMDAALELRARLKIADAQLAPSVNDLIVKASALALREHPLANGSYRNGRFELYRRVSVGIAVAAADVLVVPTITAADERSIGSIAMEARRLADAVRNGTVTAAELSGASFTVSNLGMYGMTAITPVINPPQAAILGVGATRCVLARQGDEIVERQLMTLTLTCDHRILYGADAARFLATIRGLLEAPIRLLL